MYAYVCFTVLLMVTVTLLVENLVHGPAELATIVISSTTALVASHHLRHHLRLPHNRSRELSAQGLSTTRLLALESRQDFMLRVCLANDLAAAAAIADAWLGAILICLIGPTSGLLFASDTSIC